MTLPLALYRVAAGLAAPALARRMAARPGDAALPRARQRERLGHASLPRPEGRVIWLHGASVGEGLSLLPLIAALAEADPAARYVVTTGTVSSATLLAERLPGTAVHQFAPLDAPAAVRRFLDHWRPDRLVLVESEVWPNWLAEARARRLPVALVGARLSERSLSRWRAFPRTAAEIWRGIGLVRAQAGAEALRALHPDAAPGPDLKAAAAPLAPGPDLAELTRHLAGRPVWAAVSTHPGEEELALSAHETVRETHPDALLLLVPRHPERAGAIAPGAPRRSAGALPGATDPVWLCDTLGETGTWFRLARVVFLGGSLVPVGGHNPWEPAALGRAPLHGPHVESARPAFDRLDKADAARAVTGASLGPEVAVLLSDAARCAGMNRRAGEVAAAQARDLGALARDILDLRAR